VAATAAGANGVSIGGGGPGYDYDLTVIISWFKRMSVV